MKVLDFECSRRLSDVQQESPLGATLDADKELQAVEALCSKAGGVGL